MKIRTLIAAALAASLPASGPAVARPGPANVTLRYENGHSNRERIRVSQGTVTRDFYLTLFADRDVSGKVMNLTVEMTCVDCRDSSENYMYGGRALHGIQPFIFAGSRLNELTNRREFPLANIGRRAVIEGQRFRICRSEGGAEQICAASIPITIS